MSLGLLAAVRCAQRNGDFCVQFMEGVQPRVFGKVDRNDSTVFRFMEIFNSYIEDLNTLFQSNPDSLTVPHIQCDRLVQVSVEVSNERVLEWFILEDIFPSRFGAMKRLKRHTCFLNADEFHRTLVCSSCGFPFFRSVFFV